jgi:WD40 repeat protein
MLWRTAGPLTPAKIASVAQPGRVGSVDVSATGTLAVESATGQGSDVASWDLADPAHPGVVSHPVAVDEDPAAGGEVRMSREQPTVALAGLGLWDLDGGHARRLLPGGAAVRDFDPAAGLAVVDSGSAPVLYSVAADQAPRKLASIPMPKPISASFVRGRKELVVMSIEPGQDEVISLWDLADPGHPRHVASRRYAGFGTGSAASADGATIAYWTTEGVHLWHPATGADTLLLSETSRNGLTGSVQIQGAAFSPDGSVLALSTAERVELWSVPATGQAALLAVLRGHFDGTGIGRDRPILAAGDGAYVNLWDLSRTIAALRDPVPEACRVSGGLTPAEWPQYVKDLTYTPAC